MKNVVRYFLFGVISILAYGCSRLSNEISFKKNEVRISEKVSFDGIVPYINQTALIRHGFDQQEGKTIVHYRQPENDRKIDLIIRSIVNDSVTSWQISAALVRNNDWQHEDTLKVYFNTSDTIRNGLYSVLYPTVYCWTRPVNFTDFRKIKENKGIQFAYWQTADSAYAFAMPLGGKGFTFTMSDEKNGFGAVGITGISTKIEDEIPVLSLNTGFDFYSLIPAAFRLSFESMGIADNLREKKKKPDMFNYLGWATWNAFMHDVNGEKVISAAKSFKKENIPVKWFLIDDGWLDITRNKLNSFQPDKKKFPAEFGKLTAELKSNYGIKDVGVWHTLNGYWLGISDSGRLASEFRDTARYNGQIPWMKEVKNPLLFINPFSEDGYRFYDEWYKYLSSQGITFVKVDNQLVINKLADGNYPLWNTGEKEFSNIHSAVNKYFGGRIINCMNMLNNDYYHYGQTSVARTVEDYNPKNNEKLYSCEFRGNAAAHILASVHNSVWLSNMVWPDYDMFQSDTKDAWYYAIAKIMSNGPVYLTDEPGKHNPALLRSITFSDGKLINADKPALPAEDCIFQLFGSGSPFKVFSVSGNTGLIASWNVSDRDSVEGSFSPSDIRGIKGDRFIVFNFFNKKLEEAAFNDKIPVGLGRMKCGFYSVIPLKDGRAVIGDINKIIPSAAITGTDQSENSISFRVKEPGQIWVYSGTKPQEVIIDSVKTGDFVFESNVISLKTKTAESQITIRF
jgi:hypothetical protein